MADTDPGNETTIQIPPHQEGRLLFTRRRALSERLLESITPILWVLAVGMVIAVSFWL